MSGGSSWDTRRAHRAGAKHKESGVSAFAPGWVPGGWTQPPPTKPRAATPGGRGPGGQPREPAPVLSLLLRTGAGNAASSMGARELDEFPERDDQPSQWDMVRSRTGPLRGLARMAMGEVGIVYRPRG